jgi:relaxase-like protein
LSAEVPGVISGETDQQLEEWGERLLRRRRPSDGLPTFGRLRASAVRREVRTLVRRAPQVMVKVTGGGRGMGAIKAHMAYISKRGALEVEDQEGERHRGREAVNDLAWEWRYAGSKIPEVSHRREAFNIILSMPRGTEGAVLRAAARDVMREEFKGHRYAMVLHEHQENPHVHVVVRAERSDGRRLNPRKADLHRWRERFASALRSYGIEAAATRQAVRGVIRKPDRLWETVARSEGRLRREREPLNEQRLMPERNEALKSWLELRHAFSTSSNPADRALAAEIDSFLQKAPAFARLLAGSHPRPRQTREGEQRQSDSRDVDRGT